MGGPEPVGILRVNGGPTRVAAHDMTGDPTNSDTRRAAERAARTSYGKLIAILSSRTRDLASIEDGLSDAFRAALESWPLRGVPDRPEAWLLTVARRNLQHSWRHNQVRASSATTLEMLAVENGLNAGNAVITDQRLQLLFVCTHPAIDKAVQAPLMLQTVLGLDAALIAQSFLNTPAAMNQRLVRAKIKIRDAGISFAVPDEHMLPDRIAAVLDAIYAAYGTGWEDVLGHDAKRSGLADEAIWLARALVGLMSDSAEAKGLLALLLYCESRHFARRSQTNAFIPLDTQDPRLWSRSMIVEAEELLSSAAKKAILGRFQVEAAIQSFHIQRIIAGNSSWSPCVTLYDMLVELAPSIGNRVARAAVICEAGHPDDALSELDRLELAAANYQPYWATRGHVLQRLERTSDSRAAYQRAARLTHDDSVRDFLLQASHRQPHK